MQALSQRNKRNKWNKRNKHHSKLLASHRPVLEIEAYNGIGSERFRRNDTDGRNPFLLTGLLLRSFQAKGLQRKVKSDKVAV